MTVVGASPSSFSEEAEVPRSPIELEAFGSMRARGHYSATLEEYFLRGSDIVRSP